MRVTVKIEESPLPKPLLRVDGRERLPTSDHDFQPWPIGSREAHEEERKYGTLMIPGYHPGCRVCHKHEGLH